MLISVKGANSNYMPLPGGKKNVGPNIRKEIAAGRPQKQAIAISLANERRKAGKPKRKK